MIIDFTFNADQPLNGTDITDFEKRINKNLPDDYRQHMLKWNGGGVSQLNLEHVLYPEDGDFRIENLYSIDYKTNTIETVIEYLGSALEDGYIPIGSTAGGGKILMSLKSDITYGNIKVMFSDGELHDMSPSFEQYLEDIVEGYDRYEDF